MLQPTFNNPATAALSQDNQVKILLAAYQKHAAELLAIEASQEKLTNLVLGIYSAGLTLIAALLKDAKPLLQGPNHAVSPFASALIAVAVLIGIYAIYMSTRRNNARHAVRQGLLRIDQSLGFFEQGAYLRTQALYPDDWANFANPGFLDYGHLIVTAAGLAFVFAVYIIAVG
jgi:hypothetical protein